MYMYKISLYCGQIQAALSASTSAAPVACSAVATTATASGCELEVFFLFFCFVFFEPVVAATVRCFEPWLSLLPSLMTPLPLLMSPLATVSVKGLCFGYVPGCSTPTFEAPAVNGFAEAMPLACYMITNGMRMNENVERHCECKGCGKLYGHRHKYCTYRAAVRWNRIDQPCSMLETAHNFFVTGLLHTLPCPTAPKL